MTNQPKAILFELNEVPIQVLRNYADLKPHSTIAEFLRSGDSYETYCPDEIALDPWISWSTLHRGVPDTTHGVLHLGQPSEVEDLFPPVWRRLAHAGIPTGVFGSLHSSMEDTETHKGYRFFVPDYFTTHTDAFPKFIEGFQALNIRLTRGSARNVSTTLPLGSAIRAMAMTFGRTRISPSAIRAVLTQLRTERTEPWTKVRRRNIQTVIMGDLFLRLLKSRKPRFATFYTNNVAAAMHRFWSASFPESFDQNMHDSWIDQYRNEIFVALDSVDQTLTKLKSTLSANDQILMTSSMGQGPIPFEKVDGFHVLSDLNAFLSAIGIDESQWSEQPAMVPCRSLTFATDRAMAAFTNALGRVTINGSNFVVSNKPVGPASYAISTESKFVHLFVHVEGLEAPQVEIDGKRCQNSAAGIEFLSYDDGVNNTAQHVPEGSLIVFPGVGNSSAAEQTISTLDLVPSLLQFFDVDPDPVLPGQSSVPLRIDQPIDLRVSVANPTIAHSAPTKDFS